MFTYLLINICCILIPVVLSFEKQVCYARKWKHLFPSMLITAFLFVVWDYYFTVKDIWGFNEKYLVGWHIFSLPIEEIFFFFCIPFSCVFIYELVIRFQKRNIFGRFLKPLTQSLIVILLILGTIHSNKLYTATTFISLSAILLVHIYFIKSSYLSAFFQMYIISLIPFLIVNGILTNGLKHIDSGPVVWYNNQHILGMRILNIPIEDFMYSMLLLLLNITIYEYIKNKCVSS